MPTFPSVAAIAIEVVLGEAAPILLDDTQAVCNRVPKEGAPRGVETIRQDPPVSQTKTLEDIARIELITYDLVRGRWLGENINLAPIAVLGAKLTAIEEKLESLKAQSEHLKQTLQVDMEDVKRTVREFSFFWQIRRHIAKQFKSLVARTKG